MHTIIQHMQQFAALPPHSVQRHVYCFAVSVANLEIRLQCRANKVAIAIEWGSVEPLSRITKDAGLREPHLAFSDEAAVPRFNTNAKSGFEHLGASSPALPSTTQWGSVEPLSRITKDARVQASHLVLSDEAVVPRFNTLAAKLGNPALVQRTK
ncbi:unnamed protein product [Heterotrigona itama]|uniref:Uncharacterized protein n=1 Tax=Heterotrigona itama TaxID=395501 RepID=A0A6V7GZN9_9HYME|nr:unnamed protein product [Heterotrigona itama]